MEEMFDLFSMVAEKPAVEKKVEKPKKAEKSEKKPADEPVEAEGKNKASEKKTETGKKYTYPFVFHYAGRNLDVSHIFEEGKQYSSSEITKAMLQHQFYEFSGNVTYDFIESDNVLVPIFQQHRKG